MPTRSYIQKYKPEFLSYFVKGGRPVDFRGRYLKAGTPVYGADMDETTFAPEVGRIARAIGYNKGCYLGQEPIVMSRDRAGHAPRSFVRLALSGDPPAPGAKIMVGEEEAGAVTSSAKTVGGSVALGYVRGDAANVLHAGTATQVGLWGENVAVKLYDRWVLKD